MGDAASSLPPAPDMEGEPPMPEGPEPPMDDMGGGEATGKAQEISDIASQISEKDQETLLAYARSLKDTSEESNGPDMSPEAGPEMPEQGQMPMQESVVFTKKQLKKLNESFGNMDDELDREKELDHTTKLKSDKNKPVSPFDPPRKNRK